MEHVTRCAMYEAQFMQYRYARKLQSRRDSIFTARRSASAIYDIVVCLSVCPSVCQKPVMSQNG